MDDKGIWDSVEVEEVVEQPVIEQADHTTQPTRDDHGRFAKAEEPVVSQEQREEPRETQGIPSWRLKEEAEARRQAREEADRYRRELEELRKQVQQPKQQDDIFENPVSFVDNRAKEQIEPVRSEISQLREFYSQRDAIREHGAEKVKAAYEALGQGLQSGDPEATAVYQRAKSSIDPYGDIMRWHKGKTILSTIGDDPDAFVDRRLEERLKDPAFSASLLARIRGEAQARPSVVSKPPPPSLNRATTAAVLADDGEDESDGGLLKSALRR